MKINKDKIIRRTIIHYNPALKEKARYLRNNSTFTEILLWNYLKGKQLKGYDFHQQKPIDNYIVDFFCNELMLAIEIDGESHYGNEKRDKKRQKKIESYGIKFLRFDDLEIVHKLDLVIKELRNGLMSLREQTKLSNDTPLAPLKRGRYALFI